MNESAIAVWFLTLMIPAAIGGFTYAISRNKGYNGLVFGILAGCLSLLFLLPGLIFLIVMACLPPKHIRCPACGEANIHFLKVCRRCKAPLPIA
jgi:hypothetical protein